MATTVTREAYFQVGLEILADLGFGGLKLAEACLRLGVTTGSFYHYFPSWSAYTQQLIAHWFAGATQDRVARLRAETDPRKRIDATIEVGLALPHGAEAAIRAWSSVDPQVRAVQAEIDRLRFEILRDSALEILHNERHAQLFANWAVYLLVGYEQCTLPADAEGLSWISRQLVAALDDGRFISAPVQ
jgi:AcrR family transcriptional regulator